MLSKLIFGLFVAFLGFMTKRFSLEMIHYAFKDEVENRTKKFNKLLKLY